MPSFQEVEANMTILQELLAESVEEIKRHRSQSEKNEEAIIQIERQIKEQGMNLSRSGTDNSEMDVGKLWAEANITRKRLEAKTEDLMEAVERSKTNFTDIYQRFSRLSAKLNVTVKRLQQSDLIFSDELESVNVTLSKQIDEAATKMAGQIGLPGYNGSRGSDGVQGPPGLPGPTGNGNFSQCRHKFQESTPINSGSWSSESVIEAVDKRIIGATCSTDDAKEYRLSSEIVPTGPDKGRRMYKCKCAGRSDITSMKNPAKTMRCFLHYWECPLLT